jgi:hypothetical protein
MGTVLSIGVLLAGEAHAASLTLDKSPIVLGRVQSVGVTLRVEEEPGVSPDRPLRLSVNVGSFGEVTRIGPGIYKTIYTPPPTRFPQVALVAAWTENGPEAPIDFLRIPLYGITKIETQAPAGSEVRVRIGNDEFGPEITNGKGQATVLADVPPNLPDALIQVKERSGALTNRRVPIAVPAYNRLTLALVPHAIIADGESWARVEVFLDAAAEVPAERVKLLPSEGVAALMQEGNGRYVYRYTAPPGSGSKEVGFSVYVDEDPASRGLVSLALGLPAPSEVTLTPPEKSLICDGHATAPVRIRVFDSKRFGLPRQKLEVMANGQMVRAVEYKGSGLYEARLVAPSTYPPQGLVQLSATVLKPDGQGLTATANYQVLPLPLPSAVAAAVSPSPVVADGKEKAAVLLDVRDKAGLPLQGAQLIALASHGSASPVVEVGEGRYRLDYLAPDVVPPGDEALVRIVDSSGTFEKIVPVPLRRELRLLAGIRGGVTHSLHSLVGPRAGLETWLPLRMGNANLGVGLSGTFGTASQTVGQDALQTRSEASFIPIALRLGFSPYLTSRFTSYLGLGAMAAWASVKNSASTDRAVEVGYGGMGFATGAFALGPGQLFAEISFSYLPIDDPDFHLEAGGLGLECGYRIGVF